MASTVAMNPSTVPKLSWMTLAGGLGDGESGKQLVVQEALLTILTGLSYLSRFTPITNTGRPQKGQR